MNENKSTFYSYGICLLIHFYRQTPNPLPPFPLPLFDLVYTQDKYKRLEARPSFGERRWNAISKEYSLLKLKKSGSSWLKPFCPLLWSYFVKEHYIAKWSPVKESRWERLKSNNIPFLDLSDFGGSTVYNMLFQSPKSLSPLLLHSWNIF